jgi:hypothetical protein
MLHTLIPAIKEVFGAVTPMKSYLVNYSDTGLATGKLLCTLTAKTSKQSLLRIMVEGITAFNAGTNFIQLGTTANTSSNDLLVNQGVLTNGSFYPLQDDGGSQDFKRISANTPIYISASGVKATGTLTSNNTNVSNNDTVTIGTKTYTFKTALTPTEGEVLIGGSADASLLNLIRAINHSGTAGTDYSVAVANTQVTAATSVTSHTFAVTAIVGGTGGNSIASTETAATLSWGATALAGGTNPTAGQVRVYISVTPLF